jgi:hypothetical protein
MAVFNGSEVIIFGQDGQPYACQRNLTLTHTANMIDATCKGQMGWKKVLPGLREFELTLDSLTDFQSPTTGLTEIYAAMADREALVLVMSDPTFTNQLYDFTVYVKSIIPNDPVEGISSYTAVFEGTGTFDNNLLLNGAFQQGIGDSFTFWNKLINPSSDILETETGGVAGTRAVEFIMDDADIFLYQTVTLLEDDQEYKVIFWAKKNNGTGGNIRISDASGNTYDTVAMQTNSDWNQYTFNFTWEDTYETVFSFDFLIADFDSGDQIIIDNVSLTLIN